jgi:hypothetical protein
LYFPTSIEVTDEAMSCRIFTIAKIKHSNFRHGPRHPAQSIKYDFTVLIFHRTKCETVAMLITEWGKCVFEISEQGLRRGENWPSGRAVKDQGLRPIACWGCEFELCRGQGYPSLVSVACCQVERFLRRANPASKKSYWLRCVIARDLETSRTRRPWPTLGCCERGGGEIYIYIVRDFQDRGGANFTRQSTRCEKCCRNDK